MKADEKEKSLSRIRASKHDAEETRKLLRKAFNKKLLLATLCDVVLLCCGLSAVVVFPYLFFSRHVSSSTFIFAFSASIMTTCFVLLIKEKTASFADLRRCFLKEIVYSSTKTRILLLENELENDWITADKADEVLDDIYRVADHELLLTSPETPKKRV